MKLNLLERRPITKTVSKPKTNLRILYSNTSMLASKRLFLDFF